MTNGIYDAAQSNEVILKRCHNISKKIRGYVATFGINDDVWAEAISSQYFLLCLAKQLKWAKKDYINLLNRCLSSFSVTYDGNLILDSEKILITPEETSRIVTCMMEEDAADSFFTRSTKLQAKRINSEQMYLNFHYGLLIRIVSLEDTGTLREIKHKCLDCLTSENAVDTSYGWYPYRVPWITARILISLKDVDLSSYPEKDKVTSIINLAIISLFQRIDRNAAYWRSGVGKWVSKWESTGLCLEALYTWDAIAANKADVEKVMNYVCSSENRSNWLEPSVSFETEESTNNVLAAIILASVVVRVAKMHFPSIYDELCEDVLHFFETVINHLNKKDQKAYRQYCTFPQILHYILAAIETIEK